MQIHLHGGGYIREIQTITKHGRVFSHRDRRARVKSGTIGREETDPAASVGGREQSGVSRGYESERDFVR